METVYRQWEEQAAEAVRKLCLEEKDKTLLVAIDGRSGSGKSTLAEVLKARFGGNVFHMDDFFLRPEQRTTERLEEIGGNVDYERFAGVLQQIKQGKQISYRVYDCKKQQLGEAVSVEPARLNVVEGAYSMHPYFGDCYHLKIVLDIDSREQRQRILHRNGAGMLERFVNEWIPKENAYFEKFGIYEKGDLQIKSRG